jgi:hypothetical protein
MSGLAAVKRPTCETVCTPRGDLRLRGESQMKFNSGIAAAIVLSFAVAGVTACEKKGPAERAGEKIDDSAKKVGEKIEDAGDKIKDAAKKK